MSHEVVTVLVAEAGESIWGLAERCRNLGYRVFEHNGCCYVPTDDGFRELDSLWGYSEKVED